MSSMQLLSVQLTDKQFDRISNLVKGLAGINLHDGKRELVKARLNKRLRGLGLKDFDQYIDYVENDASGTELVCMLDAISTNLTSFFREMPHFEHLSQRILPRIGQQAERTGKRLRVWSAGCSSGEEPYTIAICVNEVLGNLAGWDARILATDLSTRVLERARNGVYTQERVKTISRNILGKYFDQIQGKPEKLYQVNNRLRSLVHFARLNLMESWPMRGPFDVIFCRNVMIYFDKPTQGKLVQRYWDLLAPGGTLFIGHSESLTGIRHQFRYVQPTVYEKPGRA